MATASPRDIVIGGIIVISAMSFLSGVFLMVGVEKLVRHDQIYILVFLLIPFFIFAAGLHVRRILKALTEMNGK